MQNIRIKIYKQILLSMVVIIYISVLFIVTFKYINANRYCEIDSYQKNITTGSGQNIRVNTRLKNKMYYVLSSKDNYFISYHLYNENDGLIQFDNIRTNIDNIEPGGAKDVNVQIKAPIEKGKYKIKFDIVKEGEYWFGDRGENPGVLYLIVD